MLDIKEIAAATDFGESSRHAVDYALELAQRLGAHLTLIHVYEIPSYAYMDGAFGDVDLVTPVEEGARKVLDAAVEEAKKRVPTATGVVRRGVPWEQILEAASSADADLLVLGTHGHRGVSRVLLGSVAEKVIRLSPIPVITVRDDGRAATAAQAEHREPRL